MTGLECGQRSSTWETSIQSPAPKERQMFRKPDIKKDFKDIQMIYQYDRTRRAEACYNVSLSETEAGASLV